jgi:hypothetical protein
MRLISSNQNLHGCCYAADSNRIDPSSNTDSSSMMEAFSTRALGLLERKKASKETLLTYLSGG